MNVWSLEGKSAKEDLILFGPHLNGFAHCFEIPEKIEVRLLRLGVVALILFRPRDSEGFPVAEIYWNWSLLHALTPFSARDWRIILYQDTSRLRKPAWSCQ